MIEQSREGGRCNDWSIVDARSSSLTYSAN